MSGDIWDGEGRWRGRTLAEWLPEVVADIVREHDPLQVILFGSLARGDTGPSSDIDLLVVLPDAPFAERARMMGAVRRSIRAPVPVDAFVTDPREIAREGHLTGTVLYPALHEGVVVHERAA
ncbi:MAG: nucleotidyltransferase domain-containing protein [Egibacteraceae bacterium]